MAGVERLAHALCREVTPDREVDPWAIARAMWVAPPKSLVARALELAARQEREVAQSFRGLAERADARAAALDKLRAEIERPRPRLRIVP
jgi:hypothetical protein